MPARQATPALREIRKGRRRFIGLGLGLADAVFRKGWADGEAASVLATAKAPGAVGTGRYKARDGGARDSVPDPKTGRESAGIDPRGIGPVRRFTHSHLRNSPHRRTLVRKRLFEAAAIANERALPKWRRSFPGRELGWSGRDRRRRMTSGNPAHPITDRLHEHHCIASVGFLHAHDCRPVGWLLDEQGGHRPCPDVQKGHGPGTGT